MLSLRVALGAVAGMVEIHEDVVRSAEARVGSTLCGTYILDSLLGVGGQAAVYAATHRNGSRVAVKMLHTALSTDMEIRKRFLREGYVSNAVHHDGVPRVLGDGTHEDGSIFLVMDLLVGASAETIAKWQGGRVDVSTVVGIAYQLLDVVATAHGCGVIHRDIKPGNISLTRDGVVKLLDFGVARMRSAATATRDGTTIGTPAFMSPEQALGKVKEVDARSDIYSVGAVMFTMLSGLFVHSGESANELMIMAATCRAPSLADVVSDVPEPIVQVIDRALLFEKDRRWQSAEQMREALREAYEQAYGEPIEYGKELASVLDGIEAVDFPALVAGDGWPTLLSASIARKRGPEDPVIELSLSAHSDEDGEIHSIWDDNTEVWDRNPFAASAQEAHQQVLPGGSAHTSSQPMPAPSAGAVQPVRLHRWLPMAVLTLAIAVMLLGAWLFGTPNNRRRLGAWVDGAMDSVMQRGGKATVQEVDRVVSPALTTLASRLASTPSAARAVDVYALPSVGAPRHKAPTQDVASDAAGQPEQAGSQTAVAPLGQPPTQPAGQQKKP